MTAFVLPQFSAAAEPEFGDAAGCRTWLAHLPLANVVESQRQLLSQLNEFNRFPCKASARLAVMEALREPVAFVQVEQAKRFSNRALPMSVAESAVFKDTIELWEQMRVGYLHGLVASRAGELGMQPQAALLAQRALAYTGLGMFHHYRAYREVPGAEWRALYDVYRCAEDLGVVDEPVEDYLNRDVHKTSPRVQFLRVLLMGTANSNELSQRQLTFVDYLLERWAEKAEISAHPVAEEGMPPLAFDLAGGKPPERLAQAGDANLAEPRYVDTQRLAAAFKNRIGLLRRGESPAKLALGEDCVQPSCEQLLVFLYRQWCLPRPARSVQRKRVAEAAQACNNMEAIHFHISGKAFRLPGDQKELSKKQREEIATFGHVSTRHEDDYSATQGFLLEQWQIEDESPAGLRLMRPANSPGKRFGHGQLVGVRPAAAQHFMLAQVRWLMQGEHGDLHAGLRLLPGLPAAMAVRGYGINAANEQYVPALSLTGVAALKSPPTLILPIGWYKPKRVVEVYFDQALRVQLGELLDRGPDFERVAYQVLAD